MEIAEAELKTVVSKQADRTDFGLVGCSIEHLGRYRLPLYPAQDSAPYRFGGVDWLRWSVHGD